MKGGLQHRKTHGPSEEIFSKLKGTCENYNLTDGNDEVDF